jgi:hypothetical protein
MNLKVERGLKSRNSKCSLRIWVLPSFLFNICICNYNIRIEFDSQESFLFSEKIIFYQVKVIVCHVKFRIVRLRELCDLAISIASQTMKIEGLYQQPICDRYRESNGGIYDRHPDRNQLISICLYPASMFHCLFGWTLICSILMENSGHFISHASKVSWSMAEEKLSEEWIHGILRVMSARTNISWFSPSIIPTFSSNRHHLTRAKCLSTAKT